MIASNEIQQAYCKLYQAMREYLWDVDTLEDLADVEVITFDSFIDKDKLKLALSQLNRDISATIREDEDLESAYNNFKEIVDTDEPQYVELYSTLNKEA